MIPAVKKKKRWLEKKISLFIQKKIIKLKKQMRLCDYLYVVYHINTHRGLLWPGNLSEEWGFQFSFRYLYNLLQSQRAWNVVWNQEGLYANRSPEHNRDVFFRIVKIYGYLSNVWFHYCSNVLLPRRKTLSNCFDQNSYLLQTSWNKLNNRFFWFIHCRCAKH